MTAARPAKSAPVRANSSGSQPTPTPSRSRPPLSACRVAACLASRTGSCSGRMRTEVPSRTRSVTAATYVSVVRLSKIWPNGSNSSCGTTRCSDVHTEAKPSSSAARARDTVASRVRCRPKFASVRPSSTADLPPRAAPPVPTLATRGGGWEGLGRTRRSAVGLVPGNVCA